MKVKYIGATDDQVRYGRNDDPRGVLKENEIYEINKEDVHDWYTKIQLVEFPGLWFNNVCFEYLDSKQNIKD